MSYTDKIKQPEEHEQISKALSQSKQILEHVNQAIYVADNEQRLRDIQKRLDQSYMLKNKQSNTEELRGVSWYFVTRKKKSIEPRLK